MVRIQTTDLLDPRRTLEPSNQRVSLIKVSVTDMRTNKRTDHLGFDHSEDATTGGSEYPAGFGWERGIEGRSPCVTRVVRRRPGPARPTEAQTRLRSDGTQSASDEGSLSGRTIIQTIVKISVAESEKHDDWRKGEGFGRE